MRRPAALYVFTAVVLSAFVAAVAVSTWNRWRHGQLAPLDLGASVGIMLTITLWVLGTLKGGQPEQLPVGEAARKLKPTLAEDVTEQWKVEETQRGLRETSRIDVRWQSAAGSDQRTPLAGALPAVGTLGELLTGFGRQVRGGKITRLVVTGDMGAGKTAASVLLTLELKDESPLVPVLFQLSSWDLDRSLYDWMTDELLANHADLGIQRYGRQLATTMAQRHILPILDGLDELRESPTALQRIERDLNGRSFVLTSRSAAFAAANAGGVLSEALIVELQHLRADEVRTVIHDQAPGDGRLAPLVTELTAHPTGPVAEALRTPFMLSLAMKLNAALPADLLTAMGPDAVEKINRYLLGAFVANAYSNPGKTPVPPDKARRYLEFLARHVDPGTRRLAWWHLYKAVPSGVFLGLAVFNAAWACSALATAVFAFFRHPWLGFWIGLVSGVVGAFIVELIPQEDPRRARPSLRLLRAPRPATLLRTLGFGLMGAAACAVMVWFLYDLPYYVIIGGTLSGLTFALAGYVVEPSDPMKAVTPDSLLSADRAAVVWACVTGGIAGGLTGAYLGGSFPAGHRHSLDHLGILGLPTPVLALLGALAGGLLSALGLGLMALGSSSWGRFIPTNVWLAMRGSAPWHLLEFLRDARRRGVLRQVNGYYEFRHELLRDYLAEPSPVAPAGPPAVP